MTEGEGSIIKDALPFLGYSKYEYKRPVELPRYRTLPSSAHQGNFKHAVDIEVPHPDKKRTVVYAPASGTVEYVVMDNTEWGPTEASKNKLNFVNIRVGGLEFVEVAHLRPYVDENGTIHKLEVGDVVTEDTPIGEFGFNGWMELDEKGQPEPHIHIMVGRWTDNSRRKFKSLKIRWKE